MQANMTAAAGATTCTFIPAATQIWDIMNAQHIGFSKNVEELLDNSHSAGATQIRITLTQLSPDRFTLEVLDNGHGIAEADLPQVFGVGRTGKVGNGPFNQFGIGLKSVLASCDPENSAWEIYSSTGGTVCLRLAAPYRPEGMAYSLCPANQMPQQFRRGTWVKLPVSRAMFNTLKVRSATDDQRIDILAEELRVTYAPLLDKVSMTLEWAPLAGSHRVIPLSALSPSWVQSTTGTAALDLGGGLVRAEFTHGRIAPRPDALLHHKGNIASSGLEVFLNGRLIERNIFEEAWALPHPSYNSFLFRVNLLPIPAGEKDGRDALPLPTPEKDSLLRSDPKFNALMDWVRQICPSPKLDIQLPKAGGEVERCRELADLFRRDSRVDRVEREMAATLGDDAKSARTDIYLHMKDGRSILLEAKARPSKVQDLSQLASYGLLAALDGLKLDQLVLVAPKHSDAVERYARELESHWFRGTDMPKVSCVTWEDARALRF